MLPKKREKLTALKRIPDDKEDNDGAEAATA